MRTYAIPKTLKIPYTKPAIATSVTVPQRATSEVLHELVLVLLTVLINTLDRTILEIAKLIKPPIKDATFSNHPA